MTRYENKEYNYLKKFFESDINKRTYVDHIGWLHFRFCARAMDLLEEYHIKDIQYRERIKTLKEIIRGFKDDTSNR